MRKITEPKFGLEEQEALYGESLFQKWLTKEFGRNRVIMVDAERNLAWVPAKRDMLKFDWQIVLAKVYVAMATALVVYMVMHLCLLIGVAYKERHVLDIQKKATVHDNRV